jgi:hypothetical protein
MYFIGERSETVEMPESNLVTIVLLFLAIPTFIFGWYFAPVANWVSKSLVIFQGM